MIRLGWALLVLWLAQAVAFADVQGCYPASPICPVTARATNVPRDSHGRILRSEAQREAFKHANPCPSTGRGYGPCPGYIIDHVIPLKRGGEDAPTNMQWQRTEDAKAKDKVE